MIQKFNGREKNLNLNQKSDVEHEAASSSEPGLTNLWLNVNKYEEHRTERARDLLVINCSLSGWSWVRVNHCFTISKKGSKVPWWGWEWQKWCQRFVCWKCFYFSLTILKKYRIQVKNQPPKPGPPRSHNPAKIGFSSTAQGPLATHLNPFQKVLNQWFDSLQLKKKKKAE